MDPLFALALILGAVGTHAWEKSKRRSAAAWEQSRKAAAEHRAEREKARASRVKARKARVTTAKKAGPRDPMWWPWAAGWVVAGAARATIAAGQGAREGAKAGREEGQRFGRAAAERGWTTRRAWQEYRQRRTAARDARRDEKAADRDVVMQECPACGVYSPADGMVRDREHGRVCEPCAEWRATEQQPTTRRARRKQDKAAQLDHYVQGGGLRSGKGLPLRERWARHVELRSVCPTCGHGFLANRCPVPCECDCPREDCACGTVHVRGDTPGPGYAGFDHEPASQYPCDGLCSNSDINPCGAERQGLCGGCGGRGELVWNFGPEHGHFPCPECNPDGRRFTRPRVDGAVPDDEADDLTTVHDKHDNETGDTTMTAPNGNGAVATIGSGEGYASTVAALQTLAQQLGAVEETSRNLSEQLTADGIDADSLNRINDLLDRLDGVSPMADETARHVEQRHGPVAAAVGEAGGSSNVTKNVAWYDEH